MPLNNQHNHGTNIILSYTNMITMNIIISKLFVALHTSVNLWACERVKEWKNERASKKEERNKDILEEDREREMHRKDIK